MLEFSTIYTFTFYKIFKFFCNEFYLATSLNKVQAEY